MTPEERTNYIEHYGRGWSELMEQLAHTPREMWQFKPSPADWSVHEMVVHMADSETNSYLRCRKAVAQSGSAIMGYDQDVWSIALDYHQREVEDALALIRLVRKMTYDLIRTLPEAAWTHTYFHPELQEQVPLEAWLMTYAAHIPGHIQQIRGNIEDWQAR